jgi:hypothetical protein
MSNMSLMIAVPSVFLHHLEGTGPRGNTFIGTICCVTIVIILLLLLTAIELSLGGSRDETG